MASSPPGVSLSSLVGDVGRRIPYLGLRVAVTPLLAFGFEFGFMTLAEPALNEAGHAAWVPWIDGAGMTAWTLLVAGALVVEPLLRATHAYLEEMEARRRDLRRTVGRRTLEAQLRRGLEMAPSEDAALGLLGRALTHVVPDVACVALLADSSRAHLRIAVDTDPGGEAHRCGVEYPRACPAARTGHTLVFDDVHGLDACPYAFDRAASDDVAAACVPVSASGQVVGVIHGLSQRPIDENVRDDLELVAREFGTRLSVLRAIASAERAATRDPLTGLLNRRSFEAQAARVRAEGRPHVLAMLDVDHFKRLNDTHGHVAGDRALTAFAGLLAEAFEDGLVARLGGEEFAVLLSETSVDAARERFEAFRRSLPNDAKRLGVPSITVSTGIAQGNAHSDIPDLLRAADAALYVAKRAGRNQVVVSGREADSEAVPPARPPAPSEVVDPSAVPN